MKRIFYLFASASIFISACTTNAVTGRKQLSLVSESALQEEAVSQYRSFLSQNKVVTDNNSRDAEMVRRVGSRIASAITKYYTAQGKGNVLDGYKWEFNLVDNKEVNAWCMPGGKVVVYTGLLPVTQDEASLAVVMGHEIAHAVARHGNERMSQQMEVQMAGTVLSIALQNKSQQTQNIFLQSFGIGSQLGMLKYSRTHESEADKMGLVFAAMAGYNPNAAIAFWERMAASGGQKPPELLSTHPSDEKRINDLKIFMPEAMKYYKKLN